MVRRYIDELESGLINENEVMHDDEISLYNLWEKLRDGWRIVVGGLVVGVAGAVVVLMLQQPVYEAVVVIQVGQVGQVGQVKVVSQPVEPPVQAVERMRTPVFQRRVAEALKDQNWLMAIARGGVGNPKELSMQVVKGTAGPEQTPLIECRAQGVSKEAAQRKAEMVVDQLVKAHAELARPVLAHMQAEMATRRERLAVVERELLALTKLVDVASVKDDRFTQLALMTSLRTEKEAEKFSLAQGIMALQTVLELPPTRAIEEAFVPETPVSPKRSLLFALGIVGGLFVGALLVFCRDAWLRSKERAIQATKEQRGK